MLGPLFCLSLLSTVFAAPLEPRQLDGPKGIDVSHYQGTIDWAAVVANGIKFVFIKATESTDFLDPNFSANYDGATKAGLIRGGYHFAQVFFFYVAFHLLKKKIVALSRHPGATTGAAQANYFLAHGGGWSADGITLPGMLDIEYNDDGAECYGLSASAMVSWIKDFSNTYHAATTRYPIIYSTTDWWTTCTGNSAAFANDNPLFIARYASTIGTIPAGWPFATFWQYADSGPNPGDQDVFNGDAAGLSKMAKGS
ncbi:hypothetical protein D9757_004056 [Collybiopsis confluens]|uniref:Lysozyme n=1 Tax=Collybiopsis confluens TaxID=2823264 RepID=A0A8H5MEC9_9AGAR|nr:hypothetical protein D9757_004056 [Collybiopsis confluens]